MRQTIIGSRSVLVVLIGLMVLSAPAMPPRPDVKMSQSQIDEQARLGVNVMTRPVRNAGTAGLRNTPGDVTPLVTGTKMFVVAAIQFPDYSYTYATASFDSMLFGAWFSGSAKSYYQQVSYGEFNMTGSISGWYTSAQNHAYYGNSQGSARAAALVKEAAIAADASVNYADFDNDGDGYVDVFTCIHAGYGAEESGSGSDIWSHQWSFSSAGIGAYTTNDPWPGHSGQYIIVDDYTVDPERSSYTNRGTMACIGVFCHEWGHALGLPDLYDTDGGGGEGLGDWSLMAAGSWGGNGGSPYYPAHLDAWAKMQLGWWNPRAVRMPASYSIPQVETNSNGYWLMGRNRTFKEYFLVENRRKVGFDTTLMNSGLLIYHVDESVIARRLSNNQVNAGGSGWKYGVALEQADGNDDLFNGNNRGDANDPWPGGLGRTVFDSATTPNTRTNYPTSSPQYTGSYARGILTSAPTVSCSLSSGFTGQFTGGPDAGDYSWIDSDTAGGPAYGWNDISTGGTLLGYGDEARWSVTLPYSFSFYGSTYSTIWVSTNGWLSFGSNPGTNDSINRTIPNSAAPNAAAFVYWENLDVVASDSGGIYYRNFGTSPNCSTVVMWKNVRRKGLNGGSLKPINPMSFEAVLYEQDDRIVMRYRDCAVGDSLFSWGRGASVGIEDGAGSVGLQYLYNGAPAGNLLANERAIEFRYTAGPSRDVGVSRLVAPTGAVDSGAVITPACSVYNFGTTTETYSVRMKVGSSYNQTMTVTNHAPGTYVPVSFPNWTALPRGTWAVTCSTELAGDATPGNDRQSGTVNVSVRDAQAVSIVAPSGTVDSGTVITPQATVKNNGTAAATFDVRMTIAGGYTNTQTVTALAAGSTQTVTFSNWTPTQRGGPFAVRCTTMLASDMVPANNLVTGTVNVSVRDAQAVSIVAPSGTVDSGTVITPQATVKNNGTAAATFDVRMTIAGGYTNTQTVTALAAGSTQTVNFTDWTASPPGGPYAVRCTTMLANDMVGSNNLVTGQVSVRLIDAQAVSIVAPTGSVDSGVAIAPQATVKNNGTAAATFDVRMTIAGGYTNTQTVTALAAGSTQTVTFSNWTPTQRGGPFAVRCTTMLASDMVPANNLVTGTVNVSVRDAQAVSIVAPSGTVDSGTVITPQATVKNNGTAAATFDVRMTIAGGYTNTQTVTALAAGSTQTVTFSNWTPTQRGGPFAVRCTTMLASDMVPANNLVTGTVNVSVRDAQAVSIVAPSGTVDSGTVITPQATVKNNGTAAATFDVRMTIAGGYTNTQTVTALAAGSTQTVNFTDWTASPPGGPYAVRCTTMLANDMVGSNNLVTGQVSVRLIDAQAVSIVAPTGSVDSGVAIAPQATVKNNGTAAATFDVRMTIAGGYTNTQTVTALAAGSTQTVTFSNWTPTQRGGPFAVRCTTMLASDMVPANNLVTGTVNVSVRDAQAVSIVAPSGTVDSGTVITPQATVKNNGTAAATFDVRMTIAGGYTNTQTVTALAAGSTQTVTFSNWTPTQRGGPFAVRCTTMLASDMVPANNLVTGTVNVSVRDAQAVSIVAPSGTVDSGTVITPQATVKNNGTAAATFDVRMTIAGGYTNTQTVTALAAGSTQTVTFSNWTPTQRGGPFAVRCTTMLASDMVGSNNLVTGDVTVDVRDAEAVAVIAPTGSVDSGAAIVPQATVRNNGAAPATFDVRMTIGAGYLNTQTVTALAPGATQTVSFTNWTALPRGGPFAVRCTTMLAGDLVAANDAATAQVAVDVRDAQATSIVAPTGTIDSGTVVTPQATVKNEGTAAATFDVRMTIGAGYTNTQTVTALAAGATQTVSFADWTAAPRGGPFAVRCTTMLASDMVAANDLASGEVSVTLVDAQAIGITAPVGAVDSGTVTSPQATVRNNGTAAATFDVRMTIGAGYANTQTVTALAVGATQTVTFSNWTPTQRGGPFAVRCTTMLASDMVPANDTAIGNVTVDVRDARAVVVIAPLGTVDSGTIITPQAAVRNDGTAAATFDVRMTIGGGYLNTQTVTALAPGATQTVSFANWTALPRGGPFAVRCTTMLTGDMVPNNNLVATQVSVNVRDAEAFAIIAPLGTVDSGTVITPQATVKNNGTAAATFDVRMTIATGYTSTQAVAALAAGASRTVTFTDWTPILRGGPYAVRCTTMLANDMVSANDLATAQINIAVRDVQAVAIVAPVGTVDSGAAVVPKVAVRNNGSGNATFDVRMTIGAGYLDQQTVTNLAAGATQTVSFANWVPDQRGGPFAVRCTTMLTGDMVTGNDVVMSQVTVGVRDAQAVAIIAPTGLVDSGSAAAPQAIVQNNGSAAATFDVRLTIGSDYADQRTVTDLAPGLTDTVAFGEWVANERGGPFAVRCSTMLTGDLVPDNDTVSAEVTVNISDAAALAVVVPTGVVDSGAVTVPQARVRNNGTAPVTFDVLMTIDPGYADTQTVTDLAAGETLTVAFVDWTPVQRGGPFAVRCSTQLAGDMADSNDVAMGEVMVNVRDVATTWLGAPAGQYAEGAVVTPCCSLYNFGNMTETYDVRFRIGSAYDHSQTMTDHAPGTALYVTFPAWTAQPPGAFAVSCSTCLAVDIVPANDVVRRVVAVGGAPGWTERRPMPAGTAGKAVRDGGWLAFNPGDGQIYSAKGNKSTDFFAYDPAADSWRTKSAYPDGLSGKAPYKGASGCIDGSGFIYATKGNNTLEFFRYSTAGNFWNQLADVPLGVNKLKGGTDLAYVSGADTDYVYLLKGYKNEFYRYSIASGRWEMMPSAPMTAGVRYDRGSFLVYDGAGTLYVHQAKFNKLYAFDVTAKAWRASPTLEGMPFNSGITGQHKKKSRDGGCGVWSDGSIYALKGGNTQEFYRYLPASDSWRELDTMPAWGSTLRKKKVRAGADITTFGDGLLFALKGNKTLEAWRYLDGGMVMGGRPARDGVAVSGGLTVDDCRLSIAPNPLAGGHVTVGWRLPAGAEATQMRLAVYDAAGRNVLLVGLLPQRDGSKSVDLGGLTAGVYLVRLEAGATVLTSKLIIAR